MASRKSEYLDKASAALTLAERIGDDMTKRSLLQAADSWRLLAELEEPERPPVFPRSRLEE